MTTQTNNLGGTFTLPNTSTTFNRMGYGAMQLAGPHVFGPPRDIDAAIAVLREAIASGVNHIDTSDFYGPHVTNQIIKQALHPYRRWPGYRHQSRRSPRRRQILDPRPLAPGTHRRRSRQSPQPWPRQTRCRQPPRRRNHRTNRGIHQRAANRARRAAATRTHSSHRPQQRQPRTVSRSPDHHRDRLHPEPLQRRPPARRRLHRRPRKTRHRLRSVLSHWEASPRSSRPNSTQQPHPSTPRRCRSPSHGSCTARPISY